MPESGDNTDTDVGASGTVVINTDAEAADDPDVPESFVAVTVNVTFVLDGIPVTVIGDEDPVAVCPVEAVTVYDVATGELAGREKLTDAAPSLNALPAPMSVAETLVGSIGCKKSLACCECLPALLLIYLSLSISS